MSIIIKSLKNTKKISKDFSKTIKTFFQSNPNARIGVDWKDEFLVVSNNFKKLKKLNWDNVKIFSLSTYKYGDISPIEKELHDKFSIYLNLSSSNFENMASIREELEIENKLDNLFSFEESGGVDLLIFFIDSKGNFVHNDHNSELRFVNESSKNEQIISAGIKSILKAKKIICFSIDESSKDVVFKLNRKQIDRDDLITYLHLHNDITLYTLHSIIQKNEINLESFNQNISEIRSSIYSENEFGNSYHEEVESINEYDELDGVKIENQNNENIYEIENVHEAILEENEHAQIDDGNVHFDEEFNENVTEVIEDNLDELNLFSKDINDANIVEVCEVVEEKNKDKNYNLSQSNNLNINLPDNEDDLKKYIEIKQEALKQIEKIILENKLIELKNKTQEKYNLLEKIKKMDDPEDKLKLLEDIQPILNNQEPKQINKKNKCKLSYVPGIRPTPMLMVWSDINKTVFKNIQKEMILKTVVDWKITWNEGFMHLWNDGAYIIYDSNSYEIKSFVFNSDERLLFLLRYINKPLFFEFESLIDFELLNNFASKYEDEIVLEHNYE